MKAGEWRTRERKIVLISEMGDGHIANTIAMLDRQIAVADASVGLYDSLNGEMAREAAAEPAERSLEESFLFRAKRAELQAELDRRRAARPPP